MTAQARDSHIAQPAIRLPERLSKRSRTILAASDGAVLFFISVVILNGQSGPVGAAVAAAVVCATLWYCGLYRKSYAVFARDEAYYAVVGVAAAALPLIFFLCAIAQVPLTPVLAVLLFSAVGVSAVHTALHLDRRGRGPQHAGLSSITPAAWHGRESNAYRLSKRSFDIAIAIVTLIVVAPILAVVALAIYLESGRPIFFTQERVGENCRRFRIIKFRTMRVGAGLEWARPGDDRITRVGAILRRTSLDELPQLLNVIRGDMALVGPRPEMASFAKEFAAQLPSYDQRHVVAPGVTGWAQVYLARNLRPSDMPEVLPYDLFYVEHASRLLDCVIILKTAAEVLFHGAV